MRLNQAMRHSFIDAIIADIPHRDYFDKQLDRLIFDDAITQLPLAIQAVARDPELQKYLCNSYHYLRVCVSDHRCLSKHVTIFNAYGQYQESASIQAEKIRLAGEILDLQDRVNDVRERLEKAIAPILTVKQLKEWMPDFAKYLPKHLGAETPSTAVIADVRGDLSELGFPQLEGEQV